MNLFGYKLVKQEQFDAMSSLINMLDSFILVARVGGSKSKAVDFAADELQSYKREWGFE